MPLPANPAPDDRRLISWRHLSSCSTLAQIGLATKQLIGDELPDSGTRRALGKVVNSKLGIAMVTGAFAAVGPIGAAQIMAAHAAPAAPVPGRVQAQTRGQPMLDLGALHHALTGEPLDYLVRLGSAFDVPDPDRLSSEQLVNSIVYKAADSHATVLLAGALQVSEMARLQLPASLDVAALRRALELTTETELRHFAAQLHIEPARGDSTSIVDLVCERVASAQTLVALSSGLLEAGPSA